MSEFMTDHAIELPDSYPAALNFKLEPIPSLACLTLESDYIDLCKEHWHF